jgi:hypothetical protein
MMVPGLSSLPQALLFEGITSGAPPPAKAGICGK